MIRNIFQYSIDALSLGSIYALVALGIGLLYGVLQLVNFAHGDFIMVGIYALILPSTAAVATLLWGDLHWLPMVLYIFGFVIVLALLSEFLVFRWLRKANEATLMVASFAVGIILRNIIIMIYDSRPKAIEILPELTKNLDILGVIVPRLQIVTIAVTLILMIVFSLFLKKTVFGVQMRAAAEDFRMARLLGVKANMVISIAFGISGLLAAVVSILFVTQTGMTDPRFGASLVLFAFIATVIGGMGSLVGAVIGGFVVGITSVVLQILLPLDIRPFRDAFVFLAVIMILIFRPQGLIRVKTITERV